MLYDLKGGFDFFYRVKHLKIQHCKISSYFIKIAEIKKNWVTNFTQNANSTLSWGFILMVTVKRLIFGGYLNWLIWLEPKNRQIK